MPAVLQRPHQIAIQATRPDHQRREPASTDRDRLVAQQLTGRSVDSRDRVRALVGVRPEHDHDLVHVPSVADPGRSADTACWGRCHAPIKSRRTPRPATSDTTTGSQATTADSLKESQLAARSGPSPPRRTSPTPANRNSKPRSGGVATSGPAARRGSSIAIGARETDGCVSMHAARAALTLGSGGSRIGRDRLIVLLRSGPRG